MKIAFAGIPILFVLVIIMHANNAYAPCPGGPGFNCSNYPESNLLKNLQIVNLKVSPSILKVGDTFTVTATLVNNSTVPIVVDGGKCSVQDTQAELLTVILDNHVKNKAENINCAGVGWSPLLDPGKNITATSPDYTTNYVAIKPGTATITVTFSYHTIIQRDPIQTSDEQTISKSFQFLIHDVNETYTQKPPAYFASPLQQFKSGVVLKDIKCAADLQLLIKANNHSPACVKPEDISKLVERGWADKPNSLQEQLDLEHTCIGSNIACRNAESNSLSESDCGQFYTVPENHTSLNTVPVLLMKTNSTSCAKLTFTVISNYNDCNGPNCQHVFDVKPTGLIDNLHYEKHGGSFSITPGKDYDNSFKIVTIPDTVDLANYPVGANYTVTYIIRSLSNATGFYDQSIPRLVCERYPLAVGYAADQVNASDFSYIDPLNPPCVSGAYGLTKVEVSGMDYKEVTLQLAVLEQAK